MKVKKIIDAFKKSGLYLDKGVFPKEEIESFQKQLHYEFPEDYKILITTIEPENVNFYFVKPYISHFDSQYIIFA